MSTRVKMDREQSLLFNLYSMRLLAGFFLTDGEMTSKQKSQYHSSNFTFLMFCLVLLEVNISYFSLNNDDSTYWQHRIINFNRPNIVSQLQNSFPVILRIWISELKKLPRKYRSARPNFFASYLLHQSPPSRIHTETENQHMRREKTTNRREVNCNSTHGQKKPGARAWENQRGA